VKRKNIGSETKRKYALLISLWSEAKNSKRNEAKRSEKNFFFSRERAKRMRNGSRFASFRFEAKNFFLRNRRTLLRGKGRDKKLSLFCFAAQNFTLDIGWVLKLRNTSRRYPTAGSGFLNLISEKHFRTKGLVFR
jgi:hypothetical protein